MKKSIIYVILLASSLVAGCSCSKEEEDTPSGGEQPAPVVETNYKVTKEQYEDLCITTSYYEKMNALNFRATYKERVGTDYYQYVTEYDNGKVHMSNAYGNSYVDFKPGTYNKENRTFSFDYYYEEDGVTNKIFIENDSAPDDMTLPSIGYVITYDELKFNSETNCYEQIPEEIVLNMYEHYTDIKIKFVNGKFISATWKMEVRYSNSTNIYDTSLEVDQYGQTVVNLPNV